jgi:hypothetical protein
MHVVAQQDVVVYGLFLDALEKYFLKFGALAATAVVRVLVTDAITFKAQAAAITILKWLQPIQAANTPCAQQVFIDA